MLSLTILPFVSLVSTYVPSFCFWIYFYTGLIVGAVTWAGSLRGPVKTNVPSAIPHVSPKPGLSSYFEFLWFWLSFLTLVAAVKSLPALPFLWNIAEKQGHGEARAGSSGIWKPVHHSSVWTELGLPWPWKRMVCPSRLQLFFWTLSLPIPGGFYTYRSRSSLSTRALLSSRGTLPPGNPPFCRLTLLSDPHPQISDMSLGLPVKLSPIICYFY